MTLNFEAEVNVPFDFDVEALAGEVINFTLEHEDFPYEPEVNLTLVDNEGIHAINKEFREIDRPTDVLSFPMIDYPEDKVYKDVYLEHEFDKCYFDGDELILGDIVLSLERTKEQSIEFNHSFEREACYLVTHSVLHLLGYDHMEEEEKARMRGREEELLGKLNITRES